jgi:short-subunit dehydrogenase
MKNLLITWTSSGIWEYLSQELWKDNSIIWISRNQGSTNEKKHFNWDVRDIKFLEKISEEITSIDYLILNAWVGYFDKFENITPEQHQEIIETNLLSPILLSNLLLSKNKIKQGIVCIGSICWKKSMKFWASYGASKFWLRGFAMQLKNELKGLNIHIVNPRIVNTHFHKNSNIEITWKYEETSLESIYEVINSIINWEEKRFEIDL